MKKIWICITLLALIFWVSGCQTEPETPVETPQETPADEPVQPEEPQPQVQTPVQAEEPANPVTDEELNSAESAIIRAEKAGAEHYAPELFLSSNEDLEEAKSLREKDPDKSRELLASSIAKADAAYDEAIDIQISERVSKLRILEGQLYEIKADKYAPEDFQIVKDRADLLIGYLNEKDYDKADKQYSSTLRAMQNLYDTVDNNIRWIRILDRDTTAYMTEAEEKEAFLWAPEELEKANYNYSDGISRFNNYDLKGSEKSYKEAKYWAFHAISLSDKRRRLSQTDALMLDALKELEQASRDRVMDDKGNITEPDPWNGESFIEENPVQGNKADDYSDEGSSLKGYNPDGEVNTDENAMIEDGVTSVLGDEQGMTLLQQAIELWKQGVKARAEGKFDIADEYFKQSKAYSEAYAANAVANEYIVKKRDTLWAIAGKPDFLGNPFLWTKIWRRNSAIIENPDLIFPGQKLIIPPR